MHEITGSWRENSGGVGNVDRHVDEVGAVGAESPAIRRERDFRRRIGSALPIFCPALSVLVGDHFDFARGIAHVVPTKAVFASALFFPSERTSVEKQFGFITRGIDVDRRDLAFALRPSPV